MKRGFRLCSIFGWASAELNFTTYTQLSNKPRQLMFCNQHIQALVQRQEVDADGDHDGSKKGEVEKVAPKSLSATIG
jgi:hypothetical protein